VIELHNQLRLPRSRGSDSASSAQGQQSSPSAQGQQGLGAGPQSGGAGGLSSSSSTGEHSIINPADKSRSSKPSS